MAERRMFAKTIIDSDAFLDMPVTARLLYYDLAMRADDDGFINSPKKIMRIIGASQNDLDILAIKKFIIPFENGVVVIKHWRIHNYIRKDTYNPTNYKEELALLELDENNSYRLTDDLLELPSTSRQRAVDEPSTQVRLGKDSLGKDSLGKDREGVEGVNPSDVLDAYLLYCPSLPKPQKLTDKRKGHIRALLKTFTLEEIKDAFRKAEESDFLKGNNDRKWRADFDFLINQNNLTKVAEGKYNNRQSSIMDRWANVT